jgi:hypothetical protein
MQSKTLNKAKKVQSLNPVKYYAVNYVDRLYCCLGSGNWRHIFGSKPVPRMADSLLRDMVLTGISEIAETRTERDSLATNVHAALSSVGYPFVLVIDEGHLKELRLRGFRQTHLY